MKITYYGHSCFCLTTAAGIRIVFDPFTDIGYEMPIVEAEVAAVSHNHFDHCALSRVKNYKSVVKELPYCAGGVKISPIPSFHDDRCGRLRGENLIHVVEADGEVVCHLGDLGEKLDDARIDLLKNLDVLLIPVGGTYTIDATEAARLIRRIAPKRVIPMHYRTDRCSLDIDPVNGFTKQFEDVCHADFSEAEIHSLTHFITVFNRKEV